MNGAAVAANLDTLTANYTKSTYREQAVVIAHRNLYHFICELTIKKDIHGDVKKDFKHTKRHCRTILQSIVEQLKMNLHLVLST